MCRAGGEQTQWHRPHIIATLVVGGAVALPGFVFWEWKLARHPLIPFHLLKNRTIIAGLAVAMALNLCWTTQYDL
jgi:SIT family siderophore-iron:H+ symporter-like MFS transporter